MKGGIGARLLCDLAALASHASDGVFDRRKMSYGYEAYMDYVRFTEKQVVDGLRRLEKTGHIEILRESRRIKRLILTELGIKKSLEQRMKHSSRRYILGKYCQVAFDIPEIDRAERQKIRRLLRSFGFTKMQRSVWVTVNNIHRLLSRYFHHYYSHLDIKVSICRVVECKD